jgi:hypothetical protein
MLIENADANLKELSWVVKPKKLEAMRRLVQRLNQFIKKNRGERNETKNKYKLRDQ